MPIIRPGLDVAKKFTDRGVRDGSSYTRTNNLMEASSRRKGWVKWGDRYNLVKRYMGYSEIEYDGVSGDPIRLMRLTPLRYLDSDFLFATGVNDTSNHKQIGVVTSVSDDSNVAVYDKIDVEIKYDRLPYFVLEDTDVPADEEYKRFVSISPPRVSPDYVTMPAGWIRFIRDSGSSIPHNHIINYNVGKVLPIWEYTFTWHRLPEDLTGMNSPFPEILTPWDERVYGNNATHPKSYVGTVNKTDFFGFPAGTLLFLNYRIIQRASPIDCPWYVIDIHKALEYDVEFDLAYDPNGWNFKYYFGTGTNTAASGWYFVGKGTTYYAPGSVPDDYSIYNEREHKDLFKVAP